MERSEALGAMPQVSQTTAALSDALEKIVVCDTCGIAPSASDLSTG